MNWLQSLDTTLFRWINLGFTNSFFDRVMPFLSGNPLFVPAFLLVCGLLIWKGGVRGRLCVLMVILAIAFGDGVVSSTLKHVIGRPRPFLVILDAHVPKGIGRTDSGSMPSSHALNWFSATMVLFIYYRRSLRITLPLALLVSFSRIYNGVHYPSDVLAGAVIGVGCGAAVVWALDAVWQWVGGCWFPLWWRRMPSLFDPRTVPGSMETAKADARLADQHLLRLAYLVIAALLITNLAYLASGKIGLSGDEAYQWTWSKHLALSYYSKPLLIAVTQFLGTHIWGDTAFGVRFFSPIISAVIGVVMLRFLTREAGVRPAFWLMVILPTVPLLALGSVLMTIDPLSVMFWTLAMVAGWRAIQDKATTTDWFWVGLWMGLGFLSKYTALFQILSWVVLFALSPTARRQLRRPGPYVALLVNLFCALPVVIWNSQHGWITMRHVAEGGHFDEPWSFTPAYLWRQFAHFTVDFIVAETGLLNPFFFIPTVWAAIVFWRRKPANPLLIYFFSMGAPLFLCYFLFTLHSRVLPNWIAPAVLPLLCLAVVYWDERWQAGIRAVRSWLYSGLALGFFAVVLMHDGGLFTKITGLNPPRWMDAWHRVEGWPETAQVVEAARQKLMKEGQPVFLIGGHYAITGELSFYLPEAKQDLRDHPLVYFLTYPMPQNQFFFWPGYHDRKGQNALYVEELDFFSDKLSPTPKTLVDEFESVANLGEFQIIYRGRPVRRIQITECRNLR
jgi:4-amino-4-deoxy-L-arabinose transferase-like glycosyltransferase/membrane-associated phospholipid phosphatase